jgi:hypothetical protein
MFESRMAIYAATAPVALRRAFDGLAAAAREQLGHDPKSGALFLFVNTAGKRASLCSPPSHAWQAQSLRILQIREIAGATLDNCSYTYPDRFGLESGDRDLPRSRGHDLSGGEHAVPYEAVDR